MTFQSATLFLPEGRDLSVWDEASVAKFLIASLGLLSSSKIFIKHTSKETIHIALDDCFFFDADAFLLFSKRVSKNLTFEQFFLSNSMVSKLKYNSNSLLNQLSSIDEIGLIWIFCHFHSNFRNAISTGSAELDALLSGKCLEAVDLYEDLKRLFPFSRFSTIACMQSISSSCNQVNHTRQTKAKLPLPNTRNILITAALPYVNNVPHLGNIIGCVLSADVFSRYCRLRGYQSVFICGTDEYGTATETKALEEKLSCQQLCDKYYKLQKNIYSWFNIGFDYFGRTTTSKQTEIAQAIFLKLKDNNLLLKESVQQLHCETCNRFLADRYVEGICPSCGFLDARGDQCDSCNKLINATELKEPKCKICRSSPHITNSEHLFLNLTELQPKCQEFFNKSSVEGHWSPNGIGITNGWLQEGLKPRCITRDLKWGTPVPCSDASDPMAGKVFYVWFDAPIGYISITANYTEQWEQWWKNPKNVELFQFMGKDNVPFHSVIFPCSLIGTNEPWTLVNHIATTEYLNYEGGKFSKSRNIGVFGNNVVESNIGVSLWRYYLLSNRPESSDTSFQWDDFAAKINTELLSNLGNFANRTLRFIRAKYNGIIPESSSSFLTTDSENGSYSANYMIERINALLKVYIESIELTRLKAALRAALSISTLGNELLSFHKLDNSLFNNQHDRCNAVICEAANIVYLLACLFYPFIPNSSEALLRQLNAPLIEIPTEYISNMLQPGHTIGAPFHLFTRVEPEKLAELKKKYGGGNSI